MAKAPITNRVKGKMWTPTMTIEFDGNIAGGVTTCFRGLPTDQMASVMRDLESIRIQRLNFEAKASAEQVPA